MMSTNSGYGRAHILTPAVLLAMDCDHSDGRVAYQPTYYIGRYINTRRDMLSLLLHLLVVSDLLVHRKSQLLLTIQMLLILLSVVKNRPSIDVNHVVVQLMLLPFKIAKWCCISGLTIVYDRYNYS